MSSLGGHSSIVCFVAQEVDLICQWCIAHLLNLFRRVVLRASRVIVWCLCWCVYMTQVTIYVHMHFPPSLWCSQDVRRLRCDSFALSPSPNGGFIHFPPLLHPRRDL